CGRFDGHELRRTRGIGSRFWLALRALHALAGTPGLASVPRRLRWPLATGPCQDQIRERVDEYRIAVERFHAAKVRDAGLLGDAPVEDVDLVERLDVVRDEADRDGEHLPDAPRGEGGDLAL